MEFFVLFIRREQGSYFLPIRMQAPEDSQNWATICSKVAEGFSGLKLANSCMLIRKWLQTRPSKVWFWSETTSLKKVINYCNTGKLTAGLETNFSQGGVNFFLAPPTAPKLAQLRKGWVGWMGLGGSVFQWHPELKISFAYVPTLLQPFDLMCLRGAFLQSKVAKCVESQLKGQWCRLYLRNAVAIKCKIKKIKA